MAGRPRELGDMKCPRCQRVVRQRSRRQVYCSNTCSLESRADEKNGRWKGGVSRHPLYRIYQDMIARCTNSNHQRWDSYGGRGIDVCAAWREDFWQFVKDIGPRPPGVGPTGRALWSMDRINNDGNYEPGNMRWANYSQQSRNRRPERRHRGRNSKGQFV